MSEVVDLTLLASGVQEIGRELRLLRLQLDSLAARSTGQDGRMGAIDGRLAGLEQSFHDLVGEVSRGFGQVQQQATRQEKRIEAVDAGLTTLRSELAENTARIIQAIGGG